MPKMMRIDTTVKAFEAPPAPHAPRRRKVREKVCFSVAEEKVDIISTSGRIGRMPNGLTQIPEDRRVVLLKEKVRGEECVEFTLPGAMHTVTYVIENIATRVLEFDKATEEASAEVDVSVMLSALKLLEVYNTLLVLCIKLLNTICQLTLARAPMSKVVERAAQLISQMKKVNTCYHKFPDIPGLPYIKDPNDLEERVKTQLGQIFNFFIGHFQKEVNQAKALHQKPRKEAMLALTTKLYKELYVISLYIHDPSAVEHKLVIDLIGEVEKDPCLENDEMIQSMILDAIHGD